MKILSPLCASMALALLVGCASQPKSVETKEAPHSIAEQQAAQKALLAQKDQTLGLKRKIALGRISNETNYGRSLLRDSQGDPLGKQVADMLSEALTSSGLYLVFERPDLDKLKDEIALTGGKLDIVGVDTLIIGSITEFGRKTVGQSGFLSSSKEQIAFAKVDLRLVDPKTAHVYASVSGAGEASTKTGNVAGFGSRASYDGTLSDKAIAIAIDSAIDSLNNAINRQAWSADILAMEDGLVYISGGKHQGVKTGMVFDVMQKGKEVKSKQTGFTVTLPGSKVAELRIDQLFGDSEQNEGAVGTVISGNINPENVANLVVREQK